MRLSIVVPTCGRPRALASLLERLAPERQGVAPDLYEVIVCDDGGAKNAILAHHYPIPSIIDGPRRGPAANRNRGAACAKGEWLVFIDDDCKPADGWLAAIDRIAASGTADVVEGRIVATEKRYTIFHRYVENLNGGCFWSANLAIRRQVFEQLGGFDEDFSEAGGEDMELAHRFRTAGTRATFCADALVYHPPHTMRWRDLLRYSFRLRWHALYLIKTGQTLPTVTSAWKVVPAVALGRSMDLLRTSWRALRSANTGSYVSVLAGTILTWLLFPVLLFYVIVWDLRFRRMLRGRLNVGQ